ncbi:RNA polymerase-associated protein RapA [Pasteurellaceae bacterium TAE3-ERU1]|nr:RNA polymerase-associated protein RapA [Pasteurellaceae bacterium TAE3-ERU1]
MQQFAVGQRWFCESETQLGLGIVTALSPRQVRLHFPLAQETRLYARQGAPLKRLLFAQGEQAKSAEGWVMRVEQCAVRDGVVHYIGTRVDSGEQVSLAETHLAHQLTFSTAKVRLLSGVFDSNAAFDLRLAALRAQQAQFRSPLRGLRGARAALIAHQLHIAQTVAQRHAPRVLLADEVGLGKTLEAGLIIHHQLLSDKIQRVLIVLPHNLQHQWLLEMRRRFDLPFGLINEEADNPFTEQPLLICPLEWLLAEPDRVQLAERASFDMLVVDEAHHLAWHQEEPSAAYLAVERLAKAIPAVLLLSATPEQLGLESHFARLKLLDPHRFYDLDAFIREQRGYQRVVAIINQLLEGTPLSAQAQATLAQLLGQPHLVLSDDNRQATINALIDRHGTSRVLFRNTRAMIAGFPQRKVRLQALARPAQYGDEVSLTPEMDYSGAVPWWQFDPRVAAVQACLQADKQQKWLLICHTAHTAIALETALRTRFGTRCALFHEHMSVIERDRAAAYFAQGHDGARLLISSAIGAEGRNFQFASGLILFDLPAHPDRLEQAIGRLDRIGQGASIDIVVPYFADSVQARWVQWYHQGLDAFAHPCPMGEALFAEFGAQVATTNDFTALLHHTQARRAELHAAMARGRDKLLEYHSSGGEQGKRLAQQIAEDDADPALAAFAQALFACLGVDDEPLSDHHFLLRAGETMLSDFITLPEEGLPATFDRTFALSREEVMFLTWDSRLIRQGIDFVLSGDLGKSAVALLINPALPVGTCLVELVFVLQSQAPASLQLTRFLPPKPIRMLLDRHGRDLAAHVRDDAWQRQLHPVSQAVGQQMITMTKAVVSKACEQAEALVKTQSAVIIAQAKAQMQAQMGAEMARLRALSAVNASIRAEEITALSARTKQMVAYLDEASVRLDSVRLIVSNKEHYGTD